MKNGLITIETMFLIIGSVLIAAFVITVFSGRIDLLFTNPCWRTVTKSIEPLDRNLPAELVLDGDCLKKAVFTTDKDTCDIACSEYPDGDVAKKCMEKCTAKAAKTFLVMLPKTHDYVFGKDASIWNLGNMGDSKLGRALSRGLNWLDDGKPNVLILSCELKSINIDKCVGQGGTWLCQPGDKIETYRIEVEKATQNTCDIKAQKETLDQHLAGGSSGGNRNA